MGSGRDLLVCLHGFGEDRTSFAVFEKELGKDHLLLAFDFPFHGGTDWKEGLLMEPEDLPAIFEIAFAALGFSNARFSLLAYSFGGRMALHLVQIIPQQIKRLVLLAPDGLRVNFWYWLGTQTTTGNILFHATMRHPGWFFTMAAMAHAMGLLNKSIIKFVHHYLDDAAIRILLYKRWTTMRQFKPVLSAVKRQIAAYSIPVSFVFGSYDRIILTKRSASFKKDTDNVQIIELQAGHRLLKETHAKEIAALFSR